MDNFNYSSTRTRTDLTIAFDSDRTSGQVTMSLTATQTSALEVPQFKIRL